MAVHDSVARAIEALRSDGALDSTKEALAEVALNLAAALDEGAGMATAAVARELRATLSAMSEVDGDSDDDGFAELTAFLSAPVRDSEEP